MKKKRVLLFAILSIAIALSGCGNSQGQNSGKTEATEKPVSNEPVTLTIYQSGATISDDEFAQYIVNPLKKTHPNITLQLINSGTGKMPEDLLAAGEFPDLIYTSDKSISIFKALGVAVDLNPFIEKQKIDLNRFDPAVIDTIKINGDKGEFYGIPFTQNAGVMVYSKDLFDKFGEKAPTDGMSWNQVISLGRKMTKTVDGVQYIGFDPGNISLLGLGLGLPYVNPDTGKASINNDSWQRVYRTVKDAFDVTGFIGTDGKYEYGIKGVLKDQNTAMTPVWLNGLLNNVMGKNLGVNWDIVSLPNFEEAVGTGREVDAHILMMSTTSKHKEQAFQVMTVISSDENQLELSKNGRISVLNTPEVQKNYGTNLQEFKGKNIPSIFKTKPRKSHIPVSDYDKIVRKIIDDSAKELALTGVDINTLLRKTEEAANAAIQTAK